MPSWFRRQRSRAAAPVMPPRSESVAVARVELAELAPAPEHYLGRLAYLTLVLFENLARAVTVAPTTQAKSALTSAVSEVLRRHEGIVTELRRLGADPVEAMEPHRVALDDFQRRTQGADWHEMLVTCYITGGFLVDFFDALAAGLPERLAERVSRVLETGDGEAVLAEQLRAAIDASPRLASRLALWARRLVGDILLVARATLALEGAAPREERIEPALAQLIAAHTRRMDALGLTA